MSSEIGGAQEIKSPPSALSCGGQLAFLTGLLSATCLFAALVWSNTALLARENIPLGDFASDILQTQKAAHGWLLVGHYNTYACNHPGPFFLYLRLLGQFATEKWTGSVLSGQLVGVMGGNAAFAGLLAALLHSLAQRAGACRSTAIAASIAALALILIQLSGDAKAGTTSALASFWMPSALILPFLCFLSAVTLTLWGSSFGLVAAAFSAAALVHGYIPMPPIVAPIWLVATAGGAWWLRKHTGRGFPRYAWFAVAVIAVVFALPPLLDVLVSPPGNLFRILKAAKESRLEAPTLSFKDVSSLLVTQWLKVRHGLWPVLLLGLIVSLTTRRYQRIVGAGMLITFLAIACSALTFAGTPAPAINYTALFFVSTALLPIALGALLVILELGRRHWGLAVSGAGLVVMICVTTGTLGSALPDHSELRAVTQSLAADIPGGTQVQFDVDTPNATQWREGHGVGRLYSVLSGVLLDLDHFRISSCVRNPALDFYVGQQRICVPSAQSPIRIYRMTLSPCSHESPQQPERIGDGIVAALSPSWRTEGRCVAITPVN